MSDAASTEPFGSTTDPGAYIPRPDTERALDALRAALRRGRRSVVLTGPPGIGKTMILQVLATRLPRKLHATYLPYAALGPQDLYTWILGLLDTPKGDDPEQTLLDKVRALRAGGRHLVLLIDDASSLPAESVVGLAQLLDAADGAVKLVLAPVDDFRSGTLLAPLAGDLEEVRFVTPLGTEEAARYVRECLERAQAPEAVRARFDDRTVEYLARASGGLPRVLNLLAGEVARGSVALLNQRAIDLGAGPAGAVPAAASEEDLPAPVAPSAPAAAPAAPEPSEAPAPDGDAVVEGDREAPAAADERSASAAEGVQEPATPEATLEAGAEDQEPEAAQEQADEEAAEALEEWEPEDAAEPPRRSEPPERIAYGLASRRGVSRELDGGPGLARRLPGLVPEAVPDWRVVLGAAALVATAAVAVPLLRSQMPDGPAAPAPPLERPAVARVERPMPEATPETRRAEPPTETRRAAVEPPVDAGRAALEPPADARRAALEPPVDVRRSPPAPAPDTAAGADLAPRPDPAPEVGVPPPSLEESTQVSPGVSIPVHINATPWARIEIDGVDVGVTPLAGVPLLPGRHLMKATLPDGTVLEREVEIGPLNRHIAFDAGDAREAASGPPAAAP